MERVPPLKPRSATETDRKAVHGTAIAAKRTGPLHPHALVVSLHDVSPKTWEKSAAVLADLAALGVGQCALLVVPDHHGEGHFLENEGFCQWLIEQSRQGHEIVIHGYEHRRARRAQEDWLSMLTTRMYTADEGEFYDIDRETACRLVLQARSDFEQLGLRPDGFIAPAWLLSKEGENGVRDAGCEYTALLGGVLDLRTGAKLSSQSLVWSVRAPWRRVVSLLWNAMLFRALRSNSLLRVAVHPVDLDHPAIWKQIRNFVGQALKDRASYTYERWITRERTFRAR